MAPAGQGLIWSDVLCCIVCNEVFSSCRAPVNLTCGHVICVQCTPQLPNNICPIDQSEATLSVMDYPINAALLSIVDTCGEYLPHWNREVSKEILIRAEQSLVSMAGYLRRAESERGGTVFSEVLSRTMQRKLVSLLCFQLVEEDGRSRALKTCRAMAERIMTELLLSQQNSSHLSTHLWTAVRARGCQFLGPAMQEDVLKLILLTLEKGALIARKTLVMYVVQILTDDYPQVSKTCVGHVVQLLYRASCFNVLKRDGESSLMQLKEEYRNYESLRREHDAQIVQMAVEGGLRISPDQWSALLYGDQGHRSHMQSIIDKLQSPQSYMQSLEELVSMAELGDILIGQMVPLLRMFDAIHPTHHERVSWGRFSDYIDSLHRLMSLHVEFMTRRNEQRIRDTQLNSSRRTTSVTCAAEKAQQLYKTRICKDVAFGRICPRGIRCTFAHNVVELRDHTTRGTGSQPSINGPQSSFLRPAMPHMMVPMAQMPSSTPGFTGDSAPITVPPPAAAPPIVPIVPVPVILQSPTHHMQPPPPAQVVVVPTGVPPPPMVVGTHPGAAQIWSAHPPPIIVPHASPPHQRATQFWIQQTSSPVYTVDGAVLNTGGDRSYCWPRTDVPVARGDQTPDAEQLIMKRNEIINRLAPLTLFDEDDPYEDGVGHVSYTVASSVLDDRGELHPMTLVVGPPTLELPPIPASFATAPLPPAPTEETMCMLGDLAQIASRSRAPSLPLVQITTVHTACPTSLLSTESAPSATVQADCSTMKVKDIINQPLPTPAIQRTQVAPIYQPSIDPSIMSDHLPSVIRPISFADPQNMVSNTLDKIVDVKERLNEAEGVMSSSAMSQQLRVELRIAEREMNALDPRTQASCLLRELQQVDRQIEQIEAGRTN